jgi:hypothetical protein
MLTNRKVVLNIWQRLKGRRRLATNAQLLINAFTVKVGNGTAPGWLGDQRGVIGEMDLACSIRLSSRMIFAPRTSIE